MALLTATVTGTRELKRALRKVLRRAERLDLYGAARMVADEAARTAPKRTGRLARSIRPLGGGAVGSHLPYAGYVHWGTRRGANLRAGRCPQRRPVRLGGDQQSARRHHGGLGESDRGASPQRGPRQEVKFSYGYRAVCRYRDLCEGSEAGLPAGRPRHRRVRQRRLGEPHQGVRHVQQGGAGDDPRDRRLRGAGLDVLEPGLVGFSLRPDREGPGRRRAIRVHQGRQGVRPGRGCGAALLGGRAQGLRGLRRAARAPRDGRGAACGAGRQDRHRQAPGRHFRPDRVRPADSRRPASSGSVEHPGDGRGDQLGRQCGSGCGGVRHACPRWDRCPAGCACTARSRSSRDRQAEGADAGRGPDDESPCESGGGAGPLRAAGARVSGLRADHYVLRRRWSRAGAPGPQRRPSQGRVAEPWPLGSPAVRCLW